MNLSGGSTPIALCSRRLWWVAQDMQMQAFIENYLAAEYALWVMAHTEPSDERFFAAAETFEALYFGPDLYSDVSRPRHLDTEQFTHFRGLLAAKQKRLLYCVQEEPGLGRAVVGSVDAGSTQRFELLRIRMLQGRPKIVSSYLTNFDGTFSYSGGEDAGETLPDPC